MIVAESRVTRHLIGRLDRGSDIVEALVDLCRRRTVRTGELRAVGALENVVLDEYDQKARAWRPARRFDAQFEIVHLSGNVSEKDGKPFVALHVALSRERDNGIELVGGHLVSGRVFAVEFVIDAFDDILLRRSADPSTGLPLWGEAIPLVSSAAPTTPAAPAHVPFEAPARTVAMPHGETTPSWQDVAQVSARAADPQPAPVADSADEARPSPGDFIEHPQFGRCQVERIEGDYEFVSARMRNQRLIRLSLDVLTLIPIGREGEHLLFRAQPGR